MKVGSGVGDRTFGPVTITDIVKYQGASGDFHPAHHDIEYAKSHGYPNVFSLGLLSAGYLTTMATDWLGPENVRRFSSRFRGIVWVGDVLICSLEVARKYEFEGERRVDLELRCIRGNDTVVESEATFVVVGDRG
ncbi:MAG: hypothetical protein JJU27_19780 [Gammaproteobacteria bacterium]|nr:hypothetical protein [Gammaproteobacteria bacterium]